MQGFVRRSLGLRRLHAGACPGDAHYTYSNAPSFAAHGPLSVHNRKELLAWLDGICEATQAAHGFHLVVSDDDEVLSASLAAEPGSPISLPTFITFRRVPAVLSCVQWNTKISDIRPGRTGLIPCTYRSRVGTGVSQVRRKEAWAV